MIVVIDYGMGNSGSILNMLRKIGAEAELSSQLSVIEAADKLILPGVGAFDKGMRSLHQHQLIPTLNEKVLNRRTPILGICLGMQLFTKRSDEGSSEGLGWVDAECVRFKPSEGTKLAIPHMGWNSIKPVRKHPITEGIQEDSRFYFVHSYYVKCSSTADELAVTDYGVEFTSAFAHGPVVGTQFHPEKSLRWGTNLLRRFVEDA